MTHKHPPAPNPPTRRLLSAAEYEAGVQRAAELAAQPGAAAELELEQLRSDLEFYEAHTLPAPAAAQPSKAKYRDPGTTRHQYNKPLPYLRRRGDWGPG